MRQRIKRTAIIICMLIWCINSSVYGVSDSELYTKENMRQKLNEEIFQIYGVENFYAEETTRHAGPFNEQYVEQGLEAIANGDVYSLETNNFRVAYGIPHGGEIQGQKEYLGKTFEGEHVENPKYLWTSSTISGQIHTWKLIKFPWEKRLKLPNTGNVIIDDRFDKREQPFTIPQTGEKKTMEDAIQLGMDWRYGNKKHSEVSFNGDDSIIVYEKGKKPMNNTGRWIDYVHVVQPPTYYTWGMGYVFMQGGGYFGVSIPPFCLVPGDIEVKAPRENKTAPIKNGDVVQLEAWVTSNFKDPITVGYKWEVKGKTSGNDIPLISCGGYAQDNKSIGYCKLDITGQPVPFNISFEMPEEEVEVTFIINTAKEPEELTYENNYKHWDVVWRPYLRRGSADYYLNYNELTKEIKHRVSGGTLSASVSKPKGQWTGNMTGSLGVDIEDPDGALQDVDTYNDNEEDSSLSVDEEGSSVTKNPVLRGVIDRTGFDDDPLGGTYKKVQPPEDPIIKTIVTYFSGEVSKPYMWIEQSETTRTRPDGSSYRETVSTNRYGTATSSFPEGEDVIRIGVYVYNGRENMPDVASRHFKDEVESNTHASLKKTLWWESEPYEMPVQRWMKHVLLDEEETGVEEEWTAVDGQFTRIFTQQNKAEIEWKVEEKMADIYTSDRNNAKNRKKGKDYYKHAVFATDKQLQKYIYPIKSGYYLNPAGTYTFTLKTQIYKDSADYTPEHEELVNSIIDSFRYQSNLVYTTDGQDCYTLDLTALDEELIEVDIGNTKIKDYEIPYSPVPDGYTHVFFKEILEGYEESSTKESKDKYLYREYIKEGAIYRIEEETTVTIRVNPDNNYVFTYPNMKDGNYVISAWIDDFEFKPYEKAYTIKGIKGGNLLDTIGITVKGSMYDDLNN